jgi:mannitol-1-/sugar-/sorbitol-6-phosphatase
MRSVVDNLPSVETDRSKPMVSIAAKAVLLDLDGTLVDSATVVESAWHWAAEQLGVPFRQLAPYMHGITADEALGLAIPGLDGPTKSRLAEQILSRQVESKAAVAAMPGALRLLDRLPAGSWAVVTSGSVRRAESSIHKAGLPEPPILITADDVQAGKPHPEPFMRAMGVLDVSPEECIVIEDSPHGIASGLAAGVRVLAVGTTFPPHLLEEANWLIPNLEKITVTSHANEICLRWCTR